MSKQAPFASAVDFYLPAREQFDALVADLESVASRSHTEIEAVLRRGGAEIERRLYQGRLDSLLEAERAELRANPPSPEVEVRVRKRALENDFGRVQVRRHGFTAAGEHRARFPLDEVLNLPPEIYSLSLRRRVAEEARAGAWDQTVERVDTTTCGHVPKRQAEQLAVRAAADFDAFYAAQPAPANDACSEGALLVLSSDSKGITMLPQALREGTRKLAEADRATAVRGDPMAQRKARRHDKRMAIVTAVWDQQPQRRKPSDIVHALRDKSGRRRSAKAALPRPHHKRVSASVEKSQAEGIAEMFDEAERRDPEHARTTVVLVDGEEKQIETIEQQAEAHRRSITIVLDVIHVIHYLWLAGFALCRKNEHDTDGWVVGTLSRLLTCHPLDVVASIRQTATVRGLTPDERAPVDKCAEYLRNNSIYLDYRRFLACGFPIATGVIEGACRHLIQDRLGITGARWDVPGAEAILKLRALRSSGDWDAYWRFHEKRERRRNHGVQQTAA